MFIEVTINETGIPVTINVTQIVNIHPTAVDARITSIDLAVSVGNQHAKRIICREGYEQVKHLLRQAGGTIA